MVKMPVPEQGDIVVLDFSPHQGHEQAGRRPSLVLTPQKYNTRSGLMVVCPITAHQKAYPFEVILPPQLRTKGVVLADMLRNVDWKARNIRIVERAPIGMLIQVLKKLELLFGFSRVSESFAFLNNEPDIHTLSDVRK